MIDSMGSHNDSKTMNGAWGMGGVDVLVLERVAAGSDTI
jgi:hypothetical protein